MKSLKKAHFWWNETLITYNIIIELMGLIACYSHTNFNDQNLNLARLTFPSHQEGWVLLQISWNLALFSSAEIARDKICKSQQTWLLPVASLLCPLNVCISFIARMSNSFNRWSRDAVNNQFPFWFHLTCITVLLWACLQRNNNNKKTDHFTITITAILH